MSRKTFSPILKTRLPVLFVALTCAAVSAAAAKSWLAAPAASPPLTPQTLSAQERPETERVTLRPTGFDPAQITRPQGEFILAADNLSGLREVTLTLEREKGERIRERRLPTEQFKWRARLDLPPGRYVIREAGHPDWACTLTITPK
jgi:hypothetical protein